MFTALYILLIMCTCVHIHVCSTRITRLPLYNHNVTQLPGTIGGTFKFQIIEQCIPFSCGAHSFLVSFAILVSNNAMLCIFK